MSVCLVVINVVDSEKTRQKDKQNNILEIALKNCNLLMKYNAMFRCRNKEMGYIFCSEVLNFERCSHF